MTDQSVQPDQSVQFFYLKVRTGDGGQHRVGGMAVTKTKDENYRVSASLCSDTDVFDIKYSRHSTLGRLKSDRYCAIITSPEVDFQTLLELCGVRYHSEELTQNFSGVVNNESNIYALKNAVKTLDNKY